MASKTINAAIALTFVALLLTNISLATIYIRTLLHSLMDSIYWIVTDSNITVNPGLWRTFVEECTDCIATEFEGSYGTKLDVVQAFMILAVIAFAVAIATGLWLKYHLDNKPVKKVAMGCDIFATVCLLIAVAVYAQFATDLEVIGDLHASFGLVIVAMVMSLAAAACFSVAKPTPTPNHSE